MYDNLTRTNLEFAYKQAEKRIEKLEITIGTLRTFSNEQATCIERFEKENKELQEENKKIFNDWLEACDKYGKVNLEQQKNKEQLEQAKEILKDLIDLAKIWLSEEDDDYSFIEQAEQFLKEIEK